MEMIEWPLTGMIDNSLMWRDLPYADRMRVIAWWTKWADRVIDRMNNQL